MPQKSALPGETDGVGGCLPHPAAPGSAAGASRVAGGTGGHTSVMSRSDSLSKSFMPSPSLLDAPSLAVDSPFSAIGGSCEGAGGAEGIFFGVHRPGDGLP